MMQIKCTNGMLSLFMTILMITFVSGENTRHLRVIDNPPSSYFNTAESFAFTPSIIALFVICIGAAIGLAGYRLLRPTMFICGFYLGGKFISGLVEDIFESQDYMLTLAWIAFIIGGIFTGLVVSWVYSVGVFIIGAVGGIVLANMIHKSLGYTIYSGDRHVQLYLLCFIFGIAGGMIANRIEKPAIIIASSAVGSVAMIQGIGFFLGGYPYTIDSEDYRKQDDEGVYEYSIPTAWWGYLLAHIVAFIICHQVQANHTAKDYNPQF